MPVRRTVLYSDTIQDKLAKIKGMNERLEHEVSAASETSLKRELDPSSCSSSSTTATADADTGSTDTKRARFDDSDTNKRGQRKWERRDRRGTGRDANSTSATTDASTSSSDRLPKRKVAVKFGYCGIGYSGLQINPGVKTIEGDIFQAFCTAGAVSSDNAVNPNKVGLQRAARTDRGVHAAGNLLSLKLILQPEGLKQGETLVEKVNSLLPDFIRIWGITRVQNGFNARQSCDSRMYEYLLPTYVFLPPKPGSTMHDMLVRMRSDELAKDPGFSGLDEVIDHPFWRSQGTKHDFSTDMAAKQAYRLPSTLLQRIRSILCALSGFAQLSQLYRQ